MAKKNKPEEPKKIPLIFFKTERGNEPVREWLLSLNEEDRHTVGFDLMQVQYSWPVGMPLCRSLGGGLWEVRTALEKGRIARVIFFFCNDELIALNGFIKKTQKTPKQELDLAAKRKKEYEQ